MSKLWESRISRGKCGENCNSIERQILSALCRTVTFVHVYPRHLHVLSSARKACNYEWRLCLEKHFRLSYSACSSSRVVCRVLLNTH